jgi:leucyl-tRNA synthetase
MFIGPYDQGGDFQDTGMKGMKRFLDRVWRLTSEVKEVHTSEVSRLRHKTIKKLTEAMSKFRFNVGIAHLMTYVNDLEKNGADKVDIKTLILLLAPFVPYISEELWEKLGGKFSVHQQAWPKYEEKLAQSEKVTVVVQVNGKLRGRLVLDQETAKNKDQVLSLAKPYVKDKKIIKEFFVPGKLVNLVVGV